MELQKTDLYSKAYVEILEIINHMGAEYRNKIPNKLLKFFEENKDINYDFELDEMNDNEMPIFSNETIGLLSMIELKYWATDSEKELLNQSLKENENQYQKLLREKYNPDNIFKEREEKLQNNISETTTAMVEYKESIFTKIKKWLKSIFNK